MGPRPAAQAEDQRDGWEQAGSHGRSPGGDAPPPTRHTHHSVTSAHHRQEAARSPWLTLAGLLPALSPGRGLGDEAAPRPPLDRGSDERVPTGAGQQ